MLRKENWDIEASKEFFPNPQESAHSALHKGRFNPPFKLGQKASKDEISSENKQKNP